MRKFVNFTIARQREIGGQIKWVVKNDRIVHAHDTITRFLKKKKKGITKRGRKTEEGEGDYRSMMIRHCNEVLATQKTNISTMVRSSGRTFFKRRMVSGAEASENPGLGRETCYALFKRLCACSSFAVFTYVLHTACVCALTSLRSPRRAAPEDTGHASLHARCGRTPDTGQLQAHALHARVFAYLV